MWKLHRYYLRELVINFGITFLVMFAVVLVSLVTRGINRSQGGGLLDAALITVLWTLDSFPHLLTITFLLATVLTYARAAQDRELIAIRAAGIGPRVPMMPALLVGIVLSIGASFANHYVLPEVHYMKYRVIADVARNVFTNLKLGSDRILIPGTGFVMTCAERQGSDFLDCTVYCPGDRRIQGVSSPIVRVDRISIPPVGEHSESVDIVLSGFRDPIPSPFAQASSEEFKIQLDPHGIADRGRRPDRDDDVRSDQLLGEVMREVHPFPEAATYTLLRRCGFSLMPVLLAPIGYCIAELMRHRGRVLALSVSLLPLVLFYFGEAIGARVLHSTQSPWSALIPLLLLVVFGVPLCWRQLRR
ncbi:MAG: LptF/LptG family permease [Planctomycetes bacterium]|nr:LptF/LptG family permease [Planctomycetota bacterium]